VRAPTPTTSVWCCAVHVRPLYHVPCCRITRTTALGFSSRSRRPVAPHPHPVFGRRVPMMLFDAMLKLPAPPPVGLGAVRGMAATEDEKAAQKLQKRQGNSPLCHLLDAVPVTLRVR